MNLHYKVPYRRLTCAATTMLVCSEGDTYPFSYTSSDPIPIFCNSVMPAALSCHVPDLSNTQVRYSIQRFLSHYSMLQTSKMLQCRPPSTFSNVTSSVKFHSDGKGCIKLTRFWLALVKSPLSQPPLSKDHSLQVVLYHQPRWVPNSTTPSAKTATRYTDRTPCL